MISPATKCRICGNPNLQTVMDLGDQMLTGIFPRKQTEQVTTGPLRLVKCSGGEDVCGLLQLAHSYDLSEMYGLNYGYRSGLNTSMVRHLGEKVARLSRLVNLTPGDLIVDIGSNDSTTLQAYRSDLTLVGIDPTGVKFHSYYPPNIQLIPDFFSARLIKDRFPGSKAKVVTSFSMFYDLEEPMRFMSEVHEVLADDGVWVFEQSYMPAMLEMNSFDTACHEHLEYYGLRQIKWMCDRVGFDIADVEFNDVNGGSFSITVRKANERQRINEQVDKVLAAEQAMRLHELSPYIAFSDRTQQFRRDFRAFLDAARAKNQTIAALGASTKGNVLLQYCGVTTRDISMVGEVNAEKFGAFTPGTWLPIVPESEVLAAKPDYLIVLPWHFRRHFLESPAYAGMKLVFPLPHIEVVQR
jgi:NDP-4-keto-2,6-dideoxyhexose 3-C-methyltransferase